MILQCEKLYFLVKFQLNVPLSIYDFLTVVQEPWQDHLRMRTNWLFSVEHTDNMFLLNVFVLSHKPTTITEYMTHLIVLHVSWNFTYCGTSCIVAFTCHGIPCLVVLHASCKSTLNFTCEYLHVTIHELSRMCEVIVELYRMYSSILNTLILHWAHYS